MKVGHESLAGNVRARAVLIMRHHMTESLFWSNSTDLTQVPLPPPVSLKQVKPCTFTRPVCLGSLTHDQERELLSILRQLTWSNFDVLAMEVANFLCHTQWHNISPRHFFSLSTMGWIVTRISWRLPIFTKRMSVHRTDPNIVAELLPQIFSWPWSLKN